MSWQGRKVLVTGAGGFIGSHLTEELTRQGADVRAMVRYCSNGNWGWLDESPLKSQFEVVAGDVADRDSVEGAAKGVDVIFHLAALIAIPYSYLAPESYVRTNVVGTTNVLQAARRWDVSRVVHTSTSETYGTARYVPIDEAHPLQGQSPYSASKIGADKIAESFHLSFDLPVTIVRPFNTYGPRQSARAVIPTIITQALAGGPVKLGALSPTRDFTYVGDTVAGFMTMAQAPKAVGETINLGVGSEISISDLAALIARKLGRETQLETDQQRIRPAGSEVERLLSNNAKALALTDWRPQVSLDQGLDQTIAWISENRHRFRTGTYAV